MEKDNTLSIILVVVVCVIALSVFGMLFIISNKLSEISNNLSNISNVSSKLETTETTETTEKDWDVSIIFDEAYQNPIYPFSKIQGEIGKVYYKKLNETDSFYEEYVGQEACTKRDDVYMWKDFPSIYEKEQARRAKGWYVERKKITSSKYKVLIRGQAWTDCDYEGYGYVKGELNFNANKNWEITEVVKCSAQDSNKGQVTYCKTGNNYVKFAAGNNCGGCCACSDSAGVNIEVVVEKRR